MGKSKGDFEDLDKFKNQIGNSYHQTKNFLHHVNRGANVAKQVYNVLEPLISKYVGNHIKKPINDTFKKYDDIRDKVMSTNEVRDNINDYCVEDFLIHNYQSHDAIKVKMVA